VPSWSSERIFFRPDFVYRVILRGRDSPSEIFAERFRPLDSRPCNSAFSLHLLDDGLSLSEVEDREIIWMLRVSPFPFFCKVAFFSFCGAPGSPEAILGSALVFFHHRKSRNSLPSFFFFFSAGSQSLAELLRCVLFRSGRWVLRSSFSASRFSLRPLSVFQHLHNGAGSLSVSANAWARRSERTVIVESFVDIELRVIAFWTPDNPPPPQCTSPALDSLFEVSS